MSSCLFRFFLHVDGVHLKIWNVKVELDLLLFFFAEPSNWWICPEATMTKCKFSSKVSFFFKTALPTFWTKRRKIFTCGPWVLASKKNMHQENNPILWYFDVKLLPVRGLSFNNDKNKPIRNRSRLIDYVFIIIIILLNVLSVHSLIVHCIHWNSIAIK